MSELSVHDYLIIGAGPAGLQLGYFLKCKGRDYLILEASKSAGVFYERLPRHGQMISINKRYTGYTDPETRLRYDWNSLLCDDSNLQMNHYSSQYFPQISDYKRYLVDFAEHYQLSIRYNARVSRISKKDGHFIVQDQWGQVYRCKRLIIATGIAQQPATPPIPGRELGEHYLHFSVNPDDYNDQRVLIIGKGNGAFETANALIPTARIIHICSPRPLKLAWETHFMGHVRSINTEFLDTYFLKGQNSILNARVEKLEQRPEGIIALIDYTNAGGQKMELAYDRVLLCTGFRFDASIFDEDCRPELIYNGKLPAMTEEWEAVNVPDLYFAGTLMQARDFQKTMSNVIHGFRFNIGFLSRLLDHKYEDQPLPYREISRKAEDIADQILKRVSASAALFLQPGFLCDLLVDAAPEKDLCYYENMPVDYAHASLSNQESGYYIIILDYGEVRGNPFNVIRDPDPAMASRDVYLHPVIRLYQRGQLLAEHHIPENLENNWLPDQHTLLISSNVPDRFTRQQMLDYRGRLQTFLQRQLETSCSKS